MFVFFLNILRQKSGRYVCVQLLQTLNILFENISHETSLCKDPPRRAWAWPPGGLARGADGRGAAAPWLWLREWGHHPGLECTGHCLARSEAPLGPAAASPPSGCLWEAPPHRLLSLCAWLSPGGLLPLSWVPGPAKLPPAPTLQVSAFVVSLRVTVGSMAPALGLL